VDKGRYLDADKWVSVLNVLKESSWSVNRRIDVESVFRRLGNFPYPWRRFPVGEAIISHLNGIHIDHKLIRNDGIHFDSRGEHRGYFADCWRNQRGGLVLPLGHQGIEGILVDDKGFIYRNFENDISLVGRDLQEGLYNMMFGWAMEEFKIDCEEPDELSEIYINDGAPTIHE
jgi:hypothetical protein